MATAGTSAGTHRDEAAALAAERAAAAAAAAAEQKAAGVAEAERVLEPYYLATDDLWNRLQTVNELITDTEVGGLHQERRGVPSGDDL